MKILLFGKHGQLGWELNRTLLPLGELFALGFPEIDLADTRSISKIIREFKPGIIVNDAAYTDVDKAESEPDLARLINGVAPGVMAEEARKIGAALIHYSTDYVFDGEKAAPYNEDDKPNPINVYGATKLMGEVAVQQACNKYLIFRTSWLYGTRIGGFLTKVLHWARHQKVLRIVDDKFGSPTWVRILAESTAQVIAQGKSDPVGYLTEITGLYHLAGAGVASRFEWAKAILELDPNKKEHSIKVLLPGKTFEFPAPAKRPPFSALENRKLPLLNLQLVNWRETLEFVLHQDPGAPNKTQTTESQTF